MIVQPTAHYIEQAAQMLAAGGLIGLPTETVYGLAANANNAAAVAGIYALKGRPANHPVIVHLAPQTDVAHWVNNLPDYAHSLMHQAWPGPLTLVCQRTEHAPDWVTGGQDTVGIRCPSHPVAQALLVAAAKLGVLGVAAPSANRFGRVSPTTAAHVEGEFTTPPLTLDGGACEVGIESTIVDCTQTLPRILRFGAISVEDIKRITGLAVLDGVSNNAQNTAPTTSPTTSPRVSGGLAAHYAPNTPLSLVQPTDAGKLANNTVYIGFIRPTALPADCTFYAMPQDAARFAQQLYAALRQLDDMAYAHIAVQPVPDDDAWVGVADRLQRAAATFL